MLRNEGTGVVESLHSDVSLEPCAAVMVIPHSFHYASELGLPSGQPEFGRVKLVVPLPIPGAQQNLSLLGSDRIHRTDRRRNSNRNHKWHCSCSCSRSSRGTPPPQLSSRDAVPLTA